MNSYNLNEQRNKIKNLRKALTNSEVTALSNAVIDAVLTLDFSKANNLFIYRSFNGEVDTNRLISYFLSNNKTVAYPVIKGDIMVAGIPNSNDFSPSKFGTEEPTKYLEMNKVDVCFLPLLLCDKQKNRVGYGKGFYDKFLSTHPCLKIGLGYDFQLVESLTPNPWDIPLDIIITDKQIIK
ncbi:MAG: 5-formyltetrahydrofolate cyclo-ligase [Clostridia bacterium]|nr:5-formyltetrahydrofolate cyclo-ligase [Clostridia bacterium]